MNMADRANAAGPPGIDIDALERAVNESDRSQIHRIFAAVQPTLSSVSRLAVMAEAARLLWEVFRRGRIDVGMCGEDGFIEAARQVGLCKDSERTAEMLERFFISLCGQSGKTARDSVQQAYVRRAIEYMHHAYGDPGLKIEEVANYAYISTSYLTLLLKRETGKTFSAILTDIRMEKAADLLAGTDSKTYEIAARCGFVNSTYFSTVFRRTYDMSPAEFRKQRRPRPGAASAADPAEDDPEKVENI